VETDLQLAQRAVLVGSGVALSHFAAFAGLPRERKADGSIVTAADRAVEAAIRRVLADARPDDAVLGEVAGETAGAADRRWIVDPIDGTRLFVAGDDRWLVLVALQEHGEIVAGVAAHPAQGSIFWATRGGGAFEGRVVGGRVVAETAIRAGGASEERVVAETAIRAGGTAPLAGSRLGVVPEDWGHDLVAPLVAVVPPRPWTIHPALMVARGDLDLAVQTGGQIWDFAATSLIVTEAGGSYSGLSGDPRPGAGASVYARDEPLRIAALDLMSAPAGGSARAPRSGG
jgi:histidinol-phosphatase